MGKDAFSGYYDFNPSTEIDVLLRLMPADLRHELEENTQGYFQSQYQQSYSEIRAYLFAKAPSRIHEDHLLYNLIQAIKKGECNVQQAASIIGFYTVMKFFVDAAKQGRLDQITISRDDKGDITSITISDINLLSIWHHAKSYLGRPKFFSSLGKYTDTADNKQKFGLLKLTMPSFSYQGEGNLANWKIIPIIGGPYGFPEARYAIEKQSRLISLPSYLSPQLQEKFQFKDMAKAHDAESQSIHLIFHDLFHSSEEIDLHSQCAERLDFLNFIAKSGSNAAKGTEIRKAWVEIFEEVHDTGITAGLLQKINNLNFPPKIKNDIFRKLNQYSINDAIYMQILKKYLRISSEEFSNLIKSYRTHCRLFHFEIPSRFLKIPEIKALQALMKIKNTRNEDVTLEEIEQTLQNVSLSEKSFMRSNFFRAKVPLAHDGTGSSEVINKLIQAFQ